MSPALPQLMVWTTKLLGGGKSAFTTAAKLAALWQTVPKEQRKRIEDWVRIAGTKKTVLSKAEWTVTMAEGLSAQAENPVRAREAAAFLQRARSYRVAAQLAAGLSARAKREQHRDLRKKIDALSIEMISWTVGHDAPRQDPPAPPHLPSL